MNKKLTKEPLMTIREMAYILDVSPEAIKKHIRVLFPDKMRRGRVCQLNEREVTMVKTRLRQTTKVVSSKTDLEKKILIQQAMEYLNQEVTNLKQENLILNAINKELSPKAEFYDAVTGSTDTVNIGQVAKMLNKKIGRNTLFSILRSELIFDEKNIPYQAYVDMGYFRVIESEYQKPNGSTHIRLTTVVYQKGVEYINQLLEKRREIK